MSKINPNASSLIDDYIANKDQFAREICELLRKLIHGTDDAIREDWKWNIPIFLNNGMLCGFAAFKKHVSLTFSNGAAMSDKHQLFSGDCSAKFTRTIKFSNSLEIDESKLADYLEESFVLSNTILKKKENKIEIEIPELLQNELHNNKLAKKNFETMAYTYQKEYVFYISDAKQEVTKLKRLEKVISNLEKNIKMHELYKC